MQAKGKRWEKFLVKIIHMAYSQLRSLNTVKKIANIVAIIEVADHKIVRSIKFILIVF
jgi:hypothetical protein